MSLRLAFLIRRMPALLPVVPWPSLRSARPCSWRRLCLLLALSGHAALAASGAGRTAPPAAAPPHYALPAPEPPVALLHVGRATYLATERGVWQLRGRQLLLLGRSEAPIRRAIALADTALLLGTSRGLMSFNLATQKQHVLPLPGPEPRPAITALLREAGGAVWAGAAGYGAFRQAAPGGAFEAALSAPTINDGQTTADSAVWLATNTGLYRQHRRTWTRFNEEGVANHEIPDNLVEKLLPDNAGNLWVVMSDAICVFENAGQRAAAEAELPTVRYLGRPGNEVFGVAVVPGTGRVFATALGLLLLPETPEPSAKRPAAPPPTLPFAPAPDQVVAQQRLLRPLPALPEAGPPRLVQCDNQHRVWLVSAAGITVFTAKAFRQYARGEE